MKKWYYVICGKYKRFEKPKISYIFKKTVLCIICSTCKSKGQKIFKEE